MSASSSYKEVKWLVENHMAGNWPTCDLNLGLSHAKGHSINHCLYLSCKLNNKLSPDINTLSRKITAHPTQQLAGREALGEVP